MELEPGQEATVEIRGHSDVAKSVRETLVCHAIIGKNPMKEKIMEVALSAEFISPLLRFSAEELHFKVLQVLSRKKSDYLCAKFFVPGTEQFASNSSRNARRRQRFVFAGDRSAALSAPLSTFVARKGVFGSRTKRLIVFFTWTKYSRL